MRRCILAVVVALALAAGASPAPAAARRTCHPAGSRTLVATAQARVFETRRKIEQARLTYGCLLTRRRPVRFYVPLEFPTGYGLIALAGRFAAYQVFADCAASFCDPNSVALQDLRSGKVALVDDRLRVAEVTAIVVRHTGSLAWIGSTFDEFGAVEPGSKVVAVPRGGAPTVLDQGTGVAPRSLALAGTTLYWTRDGQPFSARLR